MGYQCENTVWPTSKELDEKTKKVVERFFTLMDDKSPDVGDQLADELFTADGSMHGGLGKAVGTDALRQSRVKAWQLIHTRKHVVKTVYVQDAEGLELLLIGHVTMSFPKDIETAGEFIARISLSGTEKAKDGSPKIKVYNVWADTAPLTKAIKDATS